MSTRVHLLRGPARLQYNGVTFYSEGDVRLDLRTRTREARVAVLGPLEYWLDDVDLSVTFQPAAAWSAPLLAVLYPYGDALPGQSLFAGDDLPLVIQSPDGVQLTLQSAALTQMPALHLAGGRPAFGEATFRALTAAGGSRSGSNSLYQVDTVAWTVPVFDRTQLVAGPVSATWGTTAPWNTLQTVDGFQIEFPLKLREETLDDVGVADLSVLEVGARARFMPAGPTEDALLSAAHVQGVGADRGASLFPGADDLVLQGTSGGPLVTLYSTALVDDVPLAWSAQKPRLGRVTLAAQRPLTAGGPQPLFSVGVAS
jgi:hypothetical protein